MKPGLYYYEPYGLIYEYRYYNKELKFYEIEYIDFLTGLKTTFPDVELSEQFIINSVYLGEV